MPVDHSFSVSVQAVVTCDDVWMTPVTINFD